VPKDKIDEKKGGTVPGSLNFHGVTKPVSVDYSVKDGKRVEAKFSFNLLEHFPLVKEKFTQEDKDKLLCNTGVCAKPEVKVEVNFDFK